MHIHLWGEIVFHMRKWTQILGVTTSWNESSVICNYLTVWRHFEVCCGKFARSLGGWRGDIQMTESYPTHYRPRDTPRGQSQAATRFWHKVKDRYCPCNNIVCKREAHISSTLSKKEALNDRLYVLIFYLSSIGRWFLIRTTKVTFKGTVPWDGLAFFRPKE